MNNQRQLISQPSGPGPGCVKFMEKNACRCECEGDQNFRKKFVDLRISRGYIT